MSREEDRALIRKLMGYWLELELELDTYQHDVQRGQESNNRQEYPQLKMVSFDEQEPQNGFHVLVHCQYLLPGRIGYAYLQGVWSDGRFESASKEPYDESVAKNVLRWCYL